MSANNDGGPAFPVVQSSTTSSSEERLAFSVLPGMTLRDYFAAAALPGIYNAAIAHAQIGGAKPFSREFIAASVYAIADAMLAERAK